MAIFNFAHNGVQHGTSSEAVTHDASDSTMWIVLGSVVMAMIVYGVIRALNRRQTEEQEAEEDSEL